MGGIRAAASEYEAIGARRESGGRILAAQKRIASAFAPASILVSRQGDIVATFGRLGKFLALSGGALSNKAGDLLRPTLRAAALTAIDRAIETGGRVTARDLDVESELGTQRIDLIAETIEADGVLVVFQEKDKFVLDVERDYDTIDPGWLSPAIEENEQTSEELKSSNEEMLSMNEERQSINEELTTVNEELTHKVDELARAHADVSNFLHTSRVPMVVVDRNKRVKAFTQIICDVVPLTPADIGCSLDEIRPHTEREDWRELVDRTIDEGSDSEALVKTSDGRVYVFRCTPYRDAKHGVEGATLTFVDVTALQIARRKIENQSARLEMANSMTGTGVWEYMPAAGLVSMDERARGALEASAASDPLTLLQTLRLFDRRSVRAEWPRIRGRCRLASVLTRICGASAAGA